MRDLQLAIAIVAASGLLLLTVVARTSARRGSSAGIAIFFLGVAAAPLWISIVVMLIGSVLVRSAEYWTVAPWLVLAAYFRYTAYSVGVAVLTAAAYFATRGDVTRKVNMSLLCLAVLVPLAFVADRLQRQRAAATAADEAAKAAAVVEFVLGSAELATVAPGPNGETTARVLPGEPERYSVTVRHPDDTMKMKAIVAVTRADDGAQYRVLCMTPDLEPWGGWHQPGFTCPLGAVAPPRTR
jgi:hypothetical protein